MAEISPGIYEGQKPWTRAEFDQLKAKGIKTILSLEVWPWDVWPERRLARDYGMHYRDVPLLASPLPPSEKRVKQALLILNDPALRPIYVHCFLSRDRSAFVVGLYRVYFEGWTPTSAWDEMLRWGFHSNLRLWGLTSYFRHHSHIPAWARSPPVPRQALPSPKLKSGAEPAMRANS